MTTKADQYAASSHTDGGDDKEGTSLVEKYRQKWPVLDRIMRMQDRYASSGGTQFAAGVTYFSILSVFPLLMLLFAAAGFVLFFDPTWLTKIQGQVSSIVSGDLGKPINGVINTAIEQRSAIAGLGGLTAIWWGLAWMNHLRYAVSKMWNVDPIKGNYFARKAKDFVGLVTLIIVLIVAFGITALGSSGLTTHIISFLHLDQIHGIHYMIGAATILVGVIVNFLVFAWLLAYLPRTKVPLSAAMKGAVIGGVVFEVFKQLASLFFSRALNNPAGAIFGPIIGIMVLFYLTWTIVLYCSAFAATTPEATRRNSVPAPAPAVIQVRGTQKETQPSIARQAAGAVSSVSSAAAIVVKQQLERFTDH